MKGLFQCPPWARSFCPFRACGAKLESYMFQKYTTLAYGIYDDSLYHV